MSPLDRPNAFGRRDGASRRRSAALNVRAKAPEAAKRPMALAAALFVCLILAGLAAVFWAVPGIKAIDARKAQAEHAVSAIVNQPVDRLPRSSAAGVFSPGWFHDGAEKPDFNTVDVRSTQQLVYADYTYVTSDLNPAEMFIARNLEFNAMTKAFYVDRTLPKARLSEAEMLEINRLYRIIGHAEADQPMAWTILAALVLLMAGLGAAALLAFRSRPASAGHDTIAD